MRDDDTVVRKTSFRKGLNLVVDVTSERSTDSGNSVGKTTFLRAIDYCLGADGKSLYQDQEFKRNNEVVHSYLNKGGVAFELTLRGHSSSLVLSRSFTDGQSVNGLQVSEADYVQRVSEEVFGLTSDKPSLRQVLNKFARIEEYQTSNTLKFLYPNTRKDEYEPLYLYLFGFEDQDLLTRRRRQQQKLARARKQLTGLQQNVSKGTLRQTIKVLEREIVRKEEQAKEFRVSSSVQADLTELERVRSVSADLALEVADLEAKENRARKTIEELEMAATAIDVSALSELYSQANTEVRGLAKSFDDLQNFHNRMVGNKARFVSEIADRSSADLQSVRARLEASNARESELLNRLSNKGALGGLQAIQSELNEMYSRLGQQEGLLEKLAEREAQVQSDESALREIETTFIPHVDSLEKRVEDFNIHFSDYSRELYGEEFVLAFDVIETPKGLSFDFHIDNVNANEGQGKKRAQVAAFDLAYLELLSDLRAETARFTLQDRVEAVSGNQLETLLRLADSIDGQYVVSVLQDKLTHVDPSFATRCSILELSQSDKYLRLD